MRRYPVAEVSNRFGWNLHDCGANCVDDGSAVKIARDIALRIEQEMTYPGEVKVTVLREMRAVEYAR